MAGADETPNDRVGSVVRTRYYLRTSNLPLFLSRTPSLPYYTLVTFLRRIAGPVSCSRGGSLFVIRGEAANSFTGCEPTYPSGLPLPCLTLYNVRLHRAFTQQALRTIVKVWPFSLFCGERLPIRCCGYKPTNAPGSPLPFLPYRKRRAGS
jgi:hypothetical protein